MSAEETNSDDVLFDRLADDELSPRERQELLASLDGRTDGWRRCALALLEAHSWRREFGAYVQTAPAMQRAHNEAPPEAGRVRALPSSLHPPSSHSSRPVRWFTLAASLLLAFGVGWSFRGVREAPGTPAGSQVADNDLPSPLQTGVPVPDAQPSRDAVTLVVRDVDGNNRRLQLPLVEVSSGKTVDQANFLPTEFRENLQDRGFDLRRTRRYAPLFFEQGNELVPMVVPVEDTYVVPVKREVF